MTQKWEYKIVVLSGDNEARLEKLGEEGWELVSVTGATENDYPIAYLKRPIQ